MANAGVDDRFNIRWDATFGGYRVSTPNLSSNGERVEVVRAVVHEQYVEALDALADAADWYRRCLEDVQDRKPVRGLDEAKGSYDAAYRRARALQEHDSLASREQQGAKEAE